jgi:hypothetical protein
MICITSFPQQLQHRKCQVPYANKIIYATFIVQLDLNRRVPQNEILIKPYHITNVLSILKNLMLPLKKDRRR